MSEKKKISKPVWTAFVILSLVVVLGISSTWFIFKIFPSEIELQIKKAGITATIFGGSALFLITTWLYSSIFLKVLKAVTPVLIVGVVISWVAFKAPPPAIIVDNTTGNNSPVISNTNGNVVITINENYTEQELIEMLGMEKLKNKAHKVLVEKSGKDFGFDKDAWSKWLIENHESANK